MSIRILAAVLASSAAYGQAFEVASVKPAAPAKSTTGATGSTRSIDPSQIHYARVTLQNLLRDAYKVRRYQISGPAWLDSERYDVSAKLPEGTAKDQIPPMLQDLLLERFSMKVHWETRPERVYALVAGKNGPHLKESKDTPDRVTGMSFTTRGHMEFTSFTLAGFADTMSNFLDRPVLDMTGIPGNFDITLNVSIEDLGGMKKIVSAAGGTVAAAPENDSSSSIFTAIQELGLKLESRDVPIQHIVVDSAEKIPAGN